MISSYEIKTINNEEILYLNIDLNSEFARFNFIDKKEKIISIIKEFIKENKIKFLGTTVALLVGGMLIGNVKLEKISDEEFFLDNTISIEEKVSDIDYNENIEEYINSEISMDDGKEIIDYENTISDSVAEEKFEEIIEIPFEEKTYITIKRSNGEIKDIELEEYVLGVVSAEMPASFNEQALMAQSIIARTYALKSMERGQILTDSNSTQNYKNNEELKIMWGSNYDTYYNKIKNAVNMTEGLYLSYDGNLIEAVYHSTSNGTTEASVNVWNNFYPYLISVESPYDYINTSYEMEKTISYEELSSKLGTEVNINTDFNILGKTSGNRVESIEINGKIFKGTEFRNILSLRSTDFEITKEEDYAIFKTKGYGHGVGMSQYGANGMAKKGYSYSDILLHYYPGTKIFHL